MQSGEELGFMVSSRCKQACIAGSGLSALPALQEQLETGPGSCPADRSPLNLLLCGTQGLPARVQLRQAGFLTHSFHYRFWSLARRPRELTARIKGNLGPVQGGLFQPTAGTEHRGKCSAHSLDTSFNCLDSTGGCQHCKSLGPCPVILCNWGQQPQARTPLLAALPGAELSRDHRCHQTA